MNIGIITFHASDNCGSMLQAFALQYILVNKYNCNVEIINFSSKGQRQMYSLWDTKLRPRILRANLKSLPYWREIKAMKKDYSRFASDNFELTAHRYRKNKELFELDGKYDVVVAGGDQVWNIRCRDTDYAYFLNFVSQGMKVSFSPSLGAVDINKYASDPSIYRKMLEKFTYLSVREPNGKKWLENLTGRKISIVADPTILLTPTEWKKSLSIESSEIETKFIFYYAFSYENAELNKRLGEISRSMKLKVYVIDRKAWSVCKLGNYGFELYKKSGPNAFLSMINDAETIITDSFHGTLFAALFNKSFCNFKHKIEADPDDDRSSSLLQQLGLEDHYVLGENLKAEDLNIASDYDTVNGKLEEMRTEAFSYIETFINEARQK